MQTNVKVRFDTQRINRKKQNGWNRSRKQFKNEIVKDTERFVPRKSGQTRSRGRASIYTSEDAIRYNPVSKSGSHYGRRIYEGDSFKFRTIGTVARWFKFAKSIYKGRWERIYKRLYGRNFN